MKYKPEPLQYNKYYHVCATGNNGGEVFLERENYRYFLKLSEKYIAPISDIISYCILPNEIHFILFIKAYEDIEPWRFTYTTVSIPTIYHPTKQISHLLNAYTQAMNKKYKRTGNLFQKVFKRNEVKSVDSLKNLTVFLHLQPVITKVSQDWKSYSWSSFRHIRIMDLKFFQIHLMINNQQDFEDFLSMHDLKRINNYK